MIPRIVVTVGEPAGIGPDVLLQITEEDWNAELVIVSSPELLQARAQQLHRSIQWATIDCTETPVKHVPGTLKVVPVPLRGNCSPGHLNPENAPFVMDCLVRATDFCLQKKAQALVTGPVQKSVINAAGIPFLGHTEFLADYCKVSHVLMLFLVANIKVALLTTHLPLSAVPKAVTCERLMQTARLLHSELQNRFHCPHPKILVSGLNPHAGEEGHLGREEIEIMAPTLDILRSENKDFVGPLPADTLFTEKYLAVADCILAMYHDQALPVVKYCGFDQAVNMTLGLPIVRTSVDHGTALSLAGTGFANPGSLRAAIQCAIQFAEFG